MEIFTFFSNRNNNQFYWILVVVILCAFALSKKSFGQNSIIVTEINYHSDTTRNSGDWVELYNNGNAAVDLSGWIFTHSFLNDFFLIPSGNTIQPGEYLILCQDTTLFKSIYTEVSDYVGQFEFELSNKEDVIKIFDEFNNENNAVAYADTLDWIKAADGHGRTLELKNINENASDIHNWETGCMGGSPGMPFSSCNETIIVSEINYKSSEGFDVGDWIEIRNVSSQEVDISGWQLSDKKDSVRFVFPNSTVLLPGDNIVVAKKINKFKVKFPNVDNLLGPFGFSIGPDGEIIRLFDADEVLFFTIYYNGSSPWPIEANGQGHTLELLDSSKNMNSSSNWFAGCYGGSPGTYYSTPCALGIDAYGDEKDVSVYPNPATDYFNIEFLNVNSDNNFRVDLYDFSGKRIKIKTIQKYFSGNSTRIELKTSELNKGIYFYQVSDKKQMLHQGKIVIH